MTGKRLRKLHILHIKEKEICPTYILKINCNCENK